MYYGKNKGRDGPIAVAKNKKIAFPSHASEKRLHLPDSINCCIDLFDITVTI